MYETTFKLNGIALDLAQPSVMTVNRGTEPSLVELLVRDEEGGGTRFDKLENPVTLSIGTPDENNQPITLEMENWHIKYSEAAGPGMVLLVLEDNRKIAREQRVTVEYNIEVPSGEDDTTYRPQSLNNGKLWTCLDAAIDAIKRFGLKYTASPLARTLKAIDLPNNLGNSASGGFVSAQWDSTLPLLLDAIHCDPVLMADGSISIIDRYTESAHQLDQYAGVDGSVTQVDKHWMIPKKIKCEFETRVARKLEYEAPDPRQTGIPTTEDIQLEMVIPVLTASGEVSSYVEFFEEVERRTGLNKDQINARWFKPRVVTVDVNTDTASEMAEADDIESSIRSSFRQMFRLVNTKGMDGMSDVTIGLMAKDGSTRTTRAAYMPYSYMHKFTRVGKGASLQEYWNTVISTNVELSFARSAPWNAGMAMSDAGEILIYLIPEVGASPQARQLNPGKTATAVRVGDAIDIADPNHVLPTQGQTALESSWQLFVVYHGKLIKDRPDLGIKRLHEEVRTGFSSGEVDLLTYRIPDMTANYSYEKGVDIGADSLSLTNKDELATRSKDVTEQIKRNFKDGKAGVYTTAGVAAIVNGGIWVRGNIHSMSIAIGTKKAYSVLANWVVMPEVRPLYTHNLDRNGLPVRFIR